MLYSCCLIPSQIPQPSAPKIQLVSKAPLKYCLLYWKKSVIPKITSKNSKFKDCLVLYSFLMMLTELLKICVHASHPLKKYKFLEDRDLYTICAHMLKTASTELCSWWGLRKSLLNKKLHLFKWL